MAGWQSWSLETLPACPSSALAGTRRGESWWLRATVPQPSGITLVVTSGISHRQPDLQALNQEDANSLAERGSIVFYLSMCFCSPVSFVAHVPELQFGD